MTSSNDVMTKPMEYEVNGEAVKLTGNTIKSYLVSGNGNVTDQEAVMFMQLCKFQKLNPFLKEAYLVKFNNSPAQIITSKEAFMKRANSDPHFKGIKAGIIVQRGEELKKLNGAIKLPKDILIGGWAEVKRDDREYPITVEISLDEFGKSQSTWKQMPMNMIRKTAMVNALREAFPESLGAMYTEDDTMPSNEPKNINNQATVETIPETKKSNVDDVFGIPSETQKKADEFFEHQDGEVKKGELIDNNQGTNEKTSENAKQEELFEKGPGTPVQSKRE